MLTFQTAWKLICVFVRKLIKSTILFSTECARDPSFFMLATIEVLKGYDTMPEDLTLSLAAIDEL